MNIRDICKCIPTSSIKMEKSRFIHDSFFLYEKQINLYVLSCLNINNAYVNSNFEKSQ